MYIVPVSENGVIISSGDEVLPLRHQAIVWTNADVF